MSKDLNHQISRPRECWFKSQTPAQARRVQVLIHSDAEFIPLKEDFESQGSSSKFICLVHICILTKPPRMSSYCLPARVNRSALCWGGGGWLGRERHSELLETGLSSLCGHLSRVWLLGSLFSAGRDCTRLAVPVLQNTACRMFYRHQQGVRGGEASGQKHRTGNLHRHRKRTRPSSCSTRSSDAIMVLNKGWFRERPARTRRTALCKQKARETQTEASPRCQKVSPFPPDHLVSPWQSGRGDE